MTTRRPGFKMQAYHRTAALHGEGMELSMTWARRSLLIFSTTAAASVAACRTLEPPRPAPLGAAAPHAGHSEPVGRRGAGRTVLPVNQVVTPLGRQLELPGLRPQVLALSPDGRLLLTAGKTPELVAVDPGRGEIRQRVPLPKTPERREAGGAVAQRAATRQGRTGQLHRPRLLARRPARLPERRQRLGRGLRRRRRRVVERRPLSAAARRRCAAAHGGDPGGPRRLAGRPQALRLRQPVEHARWSWTPATGASCAPSRWAWRRTTSC